MSWSDAVRRFVKPQAVLLDLDGTLIDSVPDLAAAINSMLQTLGRPNATQQQVAHWIGNGADMLVRRALANGDESRAQNFSVNEVAQWRDVFDLAYLNTLHNATGAYSGVDTWLKLVSEPKALITNKPRKFTEPLIASLGWQAYFDVMLCGDDLAEKKPSPQPLLCACERMNVNAQACLMIGDSINDIQAAKAAGAISVGVTYGYNHGQPMSQCQPDILVDALSELIADVPK